MKNSIPMKTFTFRLMITVFVLGQLSLSAQEPKLLLDKPGTFKIVDWGVYTHYDCGFTKAETTANYQKLVAITDAARRNPVLNNIKGFDCQSLLYSGRCDNRFGYGISSEISFEFCSWSLDKGKEVKWIIEPPSWAFQVNSISSFIGGGFNVNSNTSSDSKPGFNVEQW